MSNQDQPRDRGRTTVIVCDTCSWPDGEKVKDGKNGGEAFAELIEAVSDGDVDVRRHSCLMNCNSPCSASVVGVGKTSYVLGRFEPTADAAAALLEYARGHAQSENGVVPFRQWPQGVKGKFVARIPSLGDE